MLHATYIHIHLSSYSIDNASYSHKTIYFHLQIADNPVKDFDTINIKLSGDGAKFSRTYNFILFSFTVLTGDQSKDLSSHSKYTAVKLQSYN